MTENRTHATGCVSADPDHTGACKTKDQFGYETHPSYGMATFSRWQGSVGRLFGSPLPRHDHGITLRIERGCVKHDLGRDWHSSAGGETLIEVTFSPAQFAELLTTMNVGSGIPCTLEYAGGKVEDPPEDEPVEHEHVIEEFKHDSAKTVERLRAGKARLDELLTKKVLTKADKQEISWLIGKALQDVEANAPFMVQQFGEAATRVVTAARAEMAAMVSTTVERLGLQKLGELRAAGDLAERERLAIEAGPASAPAAAPADPGPCTCAQPCDMDDDMVCHNRGQG